MGPATVSSITSLLELLHATWRSASEHPDVSGAALLVLWKRLEAVLGEVGRCVREHEGDDEGAAERLRQIEAHLREAIRREGASGLRPG